LPAKIDVMLLVIAGDGHQPAKAGNGLTIEAKALIINKERHWIFHL